MTYNVKVGNVNVDLFDIVKKYENSSANSSLASYLNDTSTHINGRNYTSYFSDSTDSNVIKVYNANKNSMVAKGTTGFQVSGTDIISETSDKLAEYAVHTNTTSSSKNIPTGCTRLNIIVVGAGGGGGGSGVSSNQNYNSGGGGGGGGVSIWNGLSVDDNTSYNVKAGSGGNSATYNDGNTGGNTYVNFGGTNYDANGGNGGSAGSKQNSNSFNNPTNGNGGTGINNATHHSDGNAGSVTANKPEYGGNGGTINNGLSGAILPIKTTPGNGGNNNGAGNSANQYGAGGGGAGGHNHNGTAQKGGSGSQGIAFVFFRYD